MDSPGDPRYRIPIFRLVQAAAYIAIGRQRDIGEDFRFLTRDLPITPKVTGTENLPRVGPVVLVANHYERPGLWMGWSGMVVARAIHEHSGRRLRWIAIAEWTDFRLWGVLIPPRVTRFLFNRFFYTFGFIAMEPEGAPAPRRAEGVRRALQAVKAGDAIGVFPEGNIGDTRAMIRAQNGSGDFLAALHARGATVIPVGLFEFDGALNAVFGSDLDLATIRTVPRADRDEAAINLAMGAVARLLPGEIQGAYALADTEAVATRTERL